MEPLLIHETLIVRFKFWLEGRIQDGMTCLNDLYGCLSHYTLGERHRAYELASTLAQQQVGVVISTGGAGYTVWIQLRSGHVQSVVDLMPRSFLEIPSGYPVTDNCC